MIHRRSAYICVHIASAHSDNYPLEQVGVYVAFSGKSNILSLIIYNFRFTVFGVQNIIKKLKNLPPGRKQIALTRYEVEVTCVVNELDILW